MAEELVTRTSVDHSIQAGQNAIAQQYEGEINMNNVLSIQGLSVPRRMVLQGLASLLGATFAPGAFAAAPSESGTSRHIATLRNLVTIGA